MTTFENKTFNNNAAFYLMLHDIYMQSIVNFKGNKIVILPMMQNDVAAFEAKLDLYIQYRLLHSHQNSVEKAAFEEQFIKLQHNSILKERRKEEGTDAFSTKCVLKDTYTA